MDVSVRIKPDANATVGLVPMTFNATTDHPDVHATGPVGFTVLADRLPVLQEPESRPSCPAQQSCPFVVTLGNQGGASDVFDLSIDTRSFQPVGMSPLHGLKRRACWSDQAKKWKSTCC